MPDQSLFNAAFSIICILFGWWLNAVWQAVKDLQSTDMKLSDKVSSIEVLVAGNYVKNDRFQSMESALFTKLDRIEEKLDKKVDK